MDEDFNNLWLSAMVVEGLVVLCAITEWRAWIL